MRREGEDHLRRDDEARRLAVLLPDNLQAHQAFTDTCPTDRVFKEKVKECQSQDRGAGRIARVEVTRPGILPDKERA